MCTPTLWSLNLRQALHIEGMIKGTIFERVHYELAPPWVTGKEDRDNWPQDDYGANFSTIPVIGLFGGLFGTVASLVQLVVGALGMFIFVIPAALSYCAPQNEDLTAAHKWFITCAKDTLCGGVMLVAYPCMIVYGHTIGWVEWTYAVCSHVCSH